jgi:hypothetical protein
VSRQRVTTIHPKGMRAANLAALLTQFADVYGQDCQVHLTTEGLVVTIRSWDHK